MTLPHDDDSDFDGLDPEKRARRLELRCELEAALANIRMNPVLLPDARTPDVWFDERKRETGSLVKPHATAPLLGSDHDQVPATNGLSRPPEHPVVDPQTLTPVAAAKSMAARLLQRPKSIPAPQTTASPPKEEALATAPATNSASGYL